MIHSPFGVKINTMNCHQLNIVTGVLDQLINKYYWKFRNTITYN